MKRRLKTILAPIILLATLGAFVYYLRRHPEMIDQLQGLPLSAIVFIILLYTVVFLAFVLVTRTSLHIYDKTMPKQENLLFNAYSALINFFGPGQSGPIFRAAYLKKRHNLSVKQFMFTTLLYFGFFAVINAMFVVVGSRPWWQTALAMIGVGSLSLLFIRRYQRRSHIKIKGGLTVGHLGLLFGATALQVVAMAVIFGIELHRVDADVSIGAILSYTGISNFSLFVALTPGAIGIREAFLVFSQSIHHIDTSSIVAANVIDRAVYLVFLGLVFILVLVTHAKDKLHVTQLKTDQE